MARFIFNKYDEPLLSYEYEDNQKVEPAYFVPIVPMVLINGADGIGTGWMTKIPNFNIREIVENLRRMMDNNDPKPMVCIILKLRQKKKISKFVCKFFRNLGTKDSRVKLNVVVSSDTLLVEKSQLLGRINWK